MSSVITLMPGSGGEDFNSRDEEVSMRRFMASLGVGSRILRPFELQPAVMRAPDYPAIAYIALGDFEPPAVTRQQNN